MRRVLFSLIATGLALQATAMVISLDEFVNQAACNNPIGLIHITVYGGTEPYTYSWSDGSDLEDRDGLPPGDYTLTVTDFAGSVASESYFILGSPWLIVGITQAESMACPNEANGSAIVIVSEFSGLPPYDLTVLRNGTPVSSSGVDQWGNPMYSGFANGDQVVTSATDALGCAGGQTQTFFGPLDTPISITDIQGECVGFLGHVTLSAPSLWLSDISLWNDQGEMVYHQPDFMSAGTVSGLAAGNYTIKQTWSGIYMEPCDTLYFPLIVPYVGDLCGSVNGTSWYDVDGDCVHDGSEVGIPYNTLLVEPGSDAVLTNGAGAFSFPLANGAYTLARTDPTLVPICPVVQPVPLTVNSDITTVAFANGSTEPLDLAVYATGGGAHPGFNFGVNATVRNLSPQVSGPVTVSITFDPLLTFVNATPTPTNVTSGAVTWDFAAFGSFQDEDVHVTLNVPIGTPLGAVLAFAAQGSNTLPESGMANNTSAWTNVVTGSFDPNDKTVRTSSASSNELYYIDVDQWMDYTIRFQNTGTAAASLVVVTDTLSTELDMLSFEQGTASHPFEVRFKPGRVVEWRFGNINLPDSNANEPASHGLVSFRIRPQSPLLAGTVIINEANIFFDFNEPVITEPSVLTAEFTTGVHEQAQGQGQLRLLPNPVNDQLWISSDGSIDAITIIAADGREVVRRSVRSTSAIIEVSDIGAGTYFLNATMNSGGLVRERFIKQ